MVVCKGVVVVYVEDWGNWDIIEIIEKVVDIVVGIGLMEIYYDCIGVGVGVKGEVNWMVYVDELFYGLVFIFWSVLVVVLDLEMYVVKKLDGMDDKKLLINKDFF